MARQLNRLSPRALSGFNKPGRYADGGGLYLSVGSGQARRWVFLFRWQGRLKEMGLGGLSSVSLARARVKAAEARALLADGVNPLDVKRAERTIPTFGKMADDLVASLEPQWRNEKHKAQWSSTLTNDAAALRDLRVDRITTADVEGVLRPIWTTKPETASRLRGRIERVLDAAKAKSYRTGENPARWKGHLSNLLPERQRLTRGHHAAMPFKDVPAFMADLRAREATAALALEFLILTAARSGEARGATWAEFDLTGMVWTIPAERTKPGKEHRVPLSEAALAVLAKAKPLTGGAVEALVFAGPKEGAGLSDAAFHALMTRMGIKRTTATPHGFRSSFRDWAGEVSPYARELAEMALSHTVGDATERAYRRGDALDKRRSMMDDWALFCCSVI